MSGPLMPWESLDALARKFGIGPYAAKPASGQPPMRPPVPAVPGGLVVEELDDRFVLDGVVYRGVPHRVAWSKDLLDGGEAHSQAGWAKRLEKGVWCLPDAPVYHATLAALYQHRDGPQKDLVKSLRRVFAKDFRDYWMTTGSRVLYRAKGSDEVVHGHGTPDAYAVQGGLVGPDGWVKPGSGLEDAMEALLGARDLGEVERVSMWASGKKPYLYRVNEKPGRDAERAVVLGRDGNYVRLIIDADDGIYNLRPARGVVVGARENTAGSRGS